MAREIGKERATKEMAKAKTEESRRKVGAKEPDAGPAANSVIAAFNARKTKSMQARANQTESLRLRGSQNWTSTSPPRSHRTTKISFG